MAKFAPVVPVHFARKLLEAGVLGDYHLLLAHDVAEKSSQYAAVFEELRASGEDPFIIMDNSVIELGRPVSLEVMEEACNAVKPSCVVLPDVVTDKNETLKLMRVTMQSWMHSHVLADIPFMAVPQGKTLTELLGCAGEINNMLGPQLKLWGMGRFVTKLLGSRKVFLEQLLKMEQMWGYNRKLHMLGFSDNIQDDIEVTKLYPEFVMGIDSAVPLRIGQQGILLEKDTDAGPRGDFWERPVDKLQTATLFNLYNIRMALSTGQ
jgi:hypothetical protein